MRTGPCARHLSNILSNCTKPLEHKIRRTTRSIHLLQPSLTDINHPSPLLNTSSWWKLSSFTIWTAHADKRAFGLTIGPSRCLAARRGNRASSTAHWRIRGGFRCTWSRAKASLPTQSGPFCSHSVADAPPLAALMDAKLCSGDKCRDHSLLPTQVFNHDALLLLLTPLDITSHKLLAL